MVYLIRQKELHQRLKVYIHTTHVQSMRKYIEYCGFVATQIRLAVIVLKW